MLRKLSITVALLSVLAFGGAFSQTTDASSGHEVKQVQYKFLYSINGETGSFSGEKAKDIMSQAFERIQQKWQKNIEMNQSEQPEETPKTDKVESKDKEGQEVQKEDKAESKKPEQQATENNEEKVDEKQEETVQQPKQSKEEVAHEPKEEQQTVQPNEPQEEEQVSELSQFEIDVVELTNVERTKQGLQPLEIDEELSVVAREKSRDMASTGYFDHNSPVYGSPFDMMKSYGVDYRTAGENIAKGQRTPEEVVNAWMNSPGHRANILNGEFTHIGVGYLEQGNHWTQMFIGK